MTSKLLHREYVSGDAVDPWKRSFFFLHFHAAEVPGCTTALTRSRRALTHRRPGLRYDYSSSTEQERLSLRKVDSV